MRVMLLLVFLTGCAQKPTIETDELLFRSCSRYGDIIICERMSRKGLLI
jgi:hypothetical protein